MREKKKKRFTWKKYHRWFGLVLSVFMLVFCVSGIILNHRQLFAGCEVSRSLMPSAYHIKNFNNGIIKGSIKINHRISKTPSDSILAYGYGGVWLTDAEMKSWKDFNKGLPKNVDGRNIRNMVQTKNGEIWCAAMMDVYRFDGKEWKMFPLADNEERIADITLTKDSTSIIAMTRSAVYEISGKKTDAANEKRDVTRKIIGQPEGFVPKVILFKTVHKIHHFEIRKICSYSDDAGTAIRAHESSRAGFAGSRAKADGAIRMKTNRRRSIRNRRRFRCLYRKTGNPQAIRSNPVKQISFTDSGVFE